MNLSKLTHSYYLSLADKQSLKTRNRLNLNRVASMLQQRDNTQLLANIGDFLP